MTDIDKLEGVELRKAVAEAVGWKWSGPHSITSPAAIGEYATDETGGGVRFQSWGCLTWDDAIAACIAGGAISNTAWITIESDGCKVAQLNPQESLWVGTGCSPETLLRSLLKFLESKHGG